MYQILLLVIILSIISTIERLDHRQCIDTAMNARSAFLVFMLLHLNQSIKAVTNAPYISYFVKRPIAFQTRKLSCFKQSIRDICCSERKNKYLCSFLMNPLYKFEREEEGCLGTWTEVDEIEFTNDEDEIEEEGFDDKYDNGQDEFIYEINYENYTSRKKKTHTSKALHKIKEHPLRTDEWLVEVKFRKESELFPSLPRNLFRKNKSRDENSQTIEQIFKFSDNGYVILVEDPTDGSYECDVQVENEKEKRSIFTCNPRYLLKKFNGNTNEEIKAKKIKEKKSKRVTKVGRWTMNTNGISFSIPVRVKMLENSFTPKFQTNSHTVHLHYHADVHLSKFQDQPRMFRGVITRDRLHGLRVKGKEIRKDLFRPVVGQFCAKGIGMDSLDTSYKSRGVGIKPGNA